jgi:outer membrane protein OmpA-like peptidoglycan-associated protein
VRCFLLLVFFFVTFQLLHAQNFPSKGDKKVRAYFDEAQKELLGRNRDFEKALKLLQKAVARDSNFVEGHRQLAEIGKLLGSNKLVVKHTMRLAELMRGSPEEAGMRAMLGQKLLQAGRYEEAAAQFEKGLNTGQPLTQDVQRDLELGMQSSKFAREAALNPALFSRKPLPPTVNRFPLQYTPSVTADGQMLVYTARKGVLPRPEFHEDIYVSRKDSNGNWGAPSPIKGAINTPGNEGTSNISADGTSLVFASCQRNRSENCDIYISYSGGDVWSEPMSLDSANSRFWESHPALTADGNQVFFTSDRPGGYGGTDLYTSLRRPDGKWGRAFNLGPAINSAKDDEMPYMHPNGVNLFFSSSGHPGMGGTDLFVSERTQPFATQQNPAGQWSAPRNLGYPLNTAENESSLFIMPDGQKAYFSVDKVGENGIYLRSIIFESDLGPILGIKNKSYYVKGTIKDKATGKPLYAQILLQQPATGTEIYRTESAVKNGRYLMVLPGGDKYRLAVSRKGYLFQSRSFDLSGDSALKDVEMDFLLEPIVAGASTVLNNLFFESAKWDLLPESQAELNAMVQLLKENPKVRVEISGHTDDVGSDEDNLALSRRRAQAVATYLTKLGVASPRLVTKGLGETAPVTPNSDEVGRARNRRIEFKVL